MQFIPLVKLHQLYDGYRQSFRINGCDLLLLQENGKTYLIDNHCPHLGASLSHASVSDNAIRCSRHGMAFDLNTGVCVGRQCSGALVHRKISYEGNQLGIVL